MSNDNRLCLICQNPEYICGCEHPKFMEEDIIDDTELIEAVAKIINSGHIQGYDISHGHVMDIIDLVRQS